MDISSVRNHSLVGTKRIIAKFKLKFKVRGVIRTVSTDFAGRSGLFVPPMKPGAPYGELRGTRLRAPCAKNGKYEYCHQFSSSVFPPREPFLSSVQPAWRQDIPHSFIISVARADVV